MHVFDLEFGCDVLLELDVVDVQHKLGHHRRGGGEHLVRDRNHSIIKQK
jgi:hypothetical protein